MMMIYDVLQTPWGPFLLVADRDGLCMADYRQGPKASAIEPDWHHVPGELDRAASLLMSYLKGEKTHLDIPLYPRGTEFQKKVWDQLMAIPYGRTRSYQQVAQDLGRPDATRAVAGAIGRNPLQIFIPCHRVIGKNGDLRGYAGGLDMKKRLLVLEKSVSHTVY